MKTLTLKVPRPHPGQRDVLRHSARFNALAAGRRFGKSQLGINRLIDGSLRGYPTAYFAPSYRMLTEVWRECIRLLRPITRQVYVQDRRIDLITGGVVEFWSLDTPDVARGRKYRRIVIDEAAMIGHLEEAWHAVLRPTLADYAGDAWFLSTPRGFNFFHTLFKRGQDNDWPDYASWQMPSSANPFLPPGEIEAARLETPDNVFAQEWQALFVADSTSIYLPEWWDGRNRYDLDELVHANLFAGRWLSWDTAFQDKESAAYSACVVGELVSPDQRGREWTLQIREVYRDRLPFPRLVDESVRLIDKWNVDGKLRAVLIEDKASGQSLVQTLRNAMPRYADAIVGFAPRGDKAARAGQASVWCRNGCVLLPEVGSAPWLKAFESELYAAPNGLNMDQCDAFGQLVFFLEHYLSAGWRMRNGVIAAA